MDPIVVQSSTRTRRRRPSRRSGRSGRASRAPGARRLVSALLALVLALGLAAVPAAASGGHDGGPDGAGTHSGSDESRDHHEGRDEADHDGDEADEADHDEADHDGDEARTAVYRVTITNLTSGQPLTPFVAAVSDEDHVLFERGHAASYGLQQLAENGGVPVLAGEAAARSDVVAVAVIGAAPAGPGGTLSGEITVTGDAERLSLAGMLVCTNDGFAGLDSVELPDDVGEVESWGARAYDAGTEIDTEAYADLVPPCDGMGGSGMSNPALAEGGVVSPHGGITGGADLVPAVHGWSGPVARVTVERIA